MIAILKYQLYNNGGLLGVEDVRLLEDKILIPYMPKSEFPYFDISTDSDDGNLRRRVGEFTIRLNLSKTIFSANGFTILDFLRDTSKPYKYMFAMEINGTTFLGSFLPENIDADYNYHKNPKHVQFLVRMIEEDFKIYLSSLGSYFEGIGMPTFEAFMHQYMLREFEVEVPTELFWSKVNAQVYFNGIAYNNASVSTNWGKVNRFETFTGLNRGLGFDWHLTLRTNVQDFYDKASMPDPNESLIPRNQVKVKIFWQSDITNSTPITLSRGSDHKETILPRKTKRNIFLRGLESTFDNDFLNSESRRNSSEFGVVRGIMMTSTGTVLGNAHENPAGTSTGAWVYIYPFFAFTNDFINVPNDVPEENYILYIDSNNGQIVGIDPPFDFSTNGYLKEETYDIEMTSYSMPANIFTNNFAGNYNNKAAQVYFWRFFTKVDGTNNEVAEFAMTNYTRYLSGGNKKEKLITAKASDVEGIDIYRRVIIQDMDGDTDYYVSNIGKLSIGKEVSFRAVQL